MQKTDHILDKNKKSISNIKNRSADYFSRYDKALQYIQKRFDNMNSTFEDYENNFMTPTKMREGRMHAIETKLKEQEDSREIEYKYFKMVLQKMLTAFEQSIYVNGSDAHSFPSKSIVYSPEKKNDDHSYPSSALSLVEKNTNTKLRANRTVKESSPEKFLPSLNKRVTATNIEFAKTPDLSTIGEKIEAKNFRRLSSAKRSNLSTNAFISSVGDKTLHKRILFLKETLELDPHLDENKAMLREHYNEPLIKDSKKSPRVNPNNSAMIISDNDVEVSDLAKGLKTGKEFIYDEFRQNNKEEQINDKKTT